MAEVTRTVAKTYFNTGDTPTETQFSNVLDSVAMPGTDAVFTALSGTAWDGSYKTLTLTSNTALTFSSTKRSGVLIVTQDATGGRTLTINGTSVAINTGANDKSIVSFLYNDVTSTYVFFCEVDIVGVSGGGGGDVTAPTLVSATVENANKSRVVFTYNEALNTSSTPATSDIVIYVGGSPVTVSAVSVTGSTVLVDLAAPITSGVTITADYVVGASPIEDAAGNNAAAFAAHAVTNNVVAATLANTAWHSWYDMAETTAIVTTTSGADTLITKLWDQMNKVGAPGSTLTDTLSQGTTANMPKLITAGINGLKSMEVDHVGPRYIGTFSSESVSKPMTRLCVFQPKVIATNFNWFLYNGSASALSAIGLDGTGKFQIYGGTVLVSGTTAVVDNKYVVWAEFQTDGTSKLYINGTLVLTGNAGSQATAFLSILGRDITGSTSVSWIADVCVYAGILPDADRISITNELKTKYGIS